MKKRADFFIDFDSGAMGSFVETTPVIGEQDLVDVWYVPMGWNVKAVCIKSIPKKAVITVQIPKTYPGTQGSYTGIIENSKGEHSLLDAFNIVLGESLSNVNEKLNDERIKARTAEHRVRESESSIDKQKKKELERTRNSGGGFSQYGNRFGGNNEDPYTF